MQDIIDLYMRMRRNQSSQTREAEAREQRELREKVLVAERILLSTICFDLKVDQPVFICAKKVKEDLKPHVPSGRIMELFQLSLNFLRDSYGTVLCLQYSPKQIALGAVFLACLQLGANPVLATTSSSSTEAGGGGASSTVARSWFELLGDAISEDILKSICNEMMSVYDPRNWQSANAAVLGGPPDMACLQAQLDILGPPTSTTASPRATADLMPPPPPSAMPPPPPPSCVEGSEEMDVVPDRAAAPSSVVFSTPSNGWRPAGSSGAYDSSWSVGHGEEEDARVAAHEARMAASPVTMKLRKSPRREVDSSLFRMSPASPAASPCCCSPLVTDRILNSKNRDCNELLV